MLFLLLYKIKSNQILLIIIDIFKKKNPQWGFLFFERKRETLRELLFLLFLKVTTFYTLIVTYYIGYRYVTCRMIFKKIIN